MNELQSCAEAFEKLLDTQYIIKVGRKGKLLEIDLRFGKGDFHHLVGLHKLRDIERIRSGARERIFDEICSGRITQSDIEKSAYYGDIAERLTLFPHIEAFLDETELYFRYDPNRNTFSVIQADFVIEGSILQEQTYLFIDKRKREASHFCRTFFPRRDMDYTMNLPRYKLLYKEKRDLSTGASIIQYDKLMPVEIR